MKKNICVFGGSVSGKEKANEEISTQMQNEAVYKPRPKSWPRSGSGKTEKGYFTRNQKGFGFVAIGGGRSDVFIGENEQGYAMEGDLVEIKVFRSRGLRGKSNGEIVNVLERASNEILARLKRTMRETVAVPVHRNSGLPFLWIAEEDDLPELETGTLVEVELLEENKHFKNIEGSNIESVFPVVCITYIAGTPELIFARPDL